MARAAVLRCEGKPDELILIELQSTVQMEDGSKVAGQDLGILDIKDGDVTLTNGPRCLHGKMQELKSPLVLMEKTGQATKTKTATGKKTLLRMLAMQFLLHAVLSIERRCSVSDHSFLSERT
ncbi:unnamed protein product [Durusdinium trenchii]|uniref:Uncharacterized protein n=1 Tax=Durusdinium trenchii TaxID=1381693 RepID=A0ABP0MD68_9DINO